MASPSRRQRRSAYQTLPERLGAGSPLASVAGGVRRRLTLRRAIALLAALLIAVSGVFVTRVILALSHTFHESPFAVAKDLLPGGHSGSRVEQMRRDLARINLALYGYGSAGHDGAFLADSIMVVSIQPQPTGPPQIAEISLPRDLVVPIDLGSGRTVFDRVNTTYASGQTGFPYRSAAYSGDQGGGGLADATLERVLGIHIDYFVGVDFEAFKAAVDAVGGIDVDVPDSFSDRMYPHGECDNGHGDCAYMRIHFDKGPQHMDGARALIFARSRESYDNPAEASNFARNRRQQLVLTAVKQKVLSVGGFRDLPGLLDALGDHVITNVPFDDALSLYDLVKDVNNASIEHLSIDDSNFVHECGRSCDASVEYPDDRTLATLHHFVAHVFPPPAAAAEHAGITVVDGSGRGQGAATRWSTLLSALGLSAADGGGGRLSTHTQVIDRSGGRDAQTARWLADFFGVTVTQSAAPGTSGAPTSGDVAVSSGGVLVVLGQDEERAFNNPSSGVYAANQ